MLTRVPRFSRRAAASTMIWLGRGGFRVSRMKHKCMMSRRPHRCYSQASKQIAGDLASRFANPFEARKRVDIDNVALTPRNQKIDPIDFQTQGFTARKRSRPQFRVHGSVLPLLILRRMSRPRSGYRPLALPDDVHLRIQSG